MLQWLGQVGAHARTVCVRVRVATTAARGAAGSSFCTGRLPRIIWQAHVCWGAGRGSAWGAGVTDTLLRLAGAGVGRGGCGGGAHQVTTALDFLHRTMRMLHLNVGAHSVYLTADGQAKLGDFELAVE